MEGLKAILDLKLDISIKNRKKKKFNGRHQFKNPFREDQFNIPEKCLNHHKSKKFQCPELTLADAVHFRNKLYRTDEKRDQNDFLYDYIKPEDIKRKRSSFSGRRMLSNYYSVEKSTGEQVSVCRDMFQSITGFGEKRCKVIFMKRYKVGLLEKIGHDSSGIVDSRKTPTKGDKIIKARKEKLLNLDAGTLETFTQAITGVQANDSTIFHIDTNPNLLKRTKKYRAKIMTESLETPETSMFAPKRRILNLKSMDVCRICLQNDRCLLNIFRKTTNQEFTPAELMVYCLPLTIDENDSLSQKICGSCFESVKIACNLKNEWMDTQKVINKCLEDSEEFEVQEIKELLNFYSDSEEDTKDLDTLWTSQVKSESEMISDLEIEDNESVEESGEDLKSPEKNKEIAFLGLRPRKCYLCNINFATTPEDHFATEHPLVKVDRCIKCLFECDYPWFMNCHMQVHLDDFKLCPHCGVKFQVESSVFSSHKIKCSGKERATAEKRRYTCEHCNEIFKRRENYLHHVRTQHTFEKPYKCSECDEAYYVKIHLRRHQLKHGIGATCFCENCGKPYLQRYELTRHQKSCFKKESTKISGQMSQP